MKRYRKLWIGLGVLILLSPLGIILPAHFNAGSAWGEWDKAELSRKVGYVPSGMQKQSEYKAPLPDYAFKGQKTAPVRKLSVFYVLSAVLGVGSVVVITILLGKALAKRDKSDPS